MSGVSARILELRKEKSRDAARSRRGKENYEFYELAKMLPLPGAITSQLDKASIIRLTISYLKLRDFSSHGDPPWNRDGPPPNKSVKADGSSVYGGPPRRRTMMAVAMEVFESHQGTHILQSLDGFAFALTNDGRFLYISETVSIYLGLSQVEMCGSSLFEYVHQQDHVELAEHLGLSLPGATTMPSPGSASDEGSSTSTANTPRALTPPLPAERERRTFADYQAAIMNPNPAKGYDRSFSIRMKSTLTKRGVHIKSSGYRVVHILGHLRPQFSFSLTRKHPPPLLGMVCLAIALPPPTINELLIDNDMFVTRLSPDFKLIYVEPRIGDLMDITADDLTNKNLYDYCHAEDLQKLRKAHTDLLNKGQVLTDYYRLLNKRGGYVWVQTCATISYSKNSDDENMIGINYVLSGIEYGGCVMDCNQLSSVNNNGPDQSDHSESESGSEHDGNSKKEDKGRQTPEREREDGDPEGHDHKPSGRKHTAPQEEHDHILGNNNKENGVSLIFHQGAASPIGMDSPLNHEESSYSLHSDKANSDSKSSRRKMDRPRKRKRDSDSDCEEGVENHVISQSLSIDSILGTNHMEASQRENGAMTAAVAIAATGTDSAHSSVPTSPQELSSKIKSPVPEDLSMKSSHPATVQSPSTQPHTPTSTNSDKHGQANSDSYSEVGAVTSSVRDLEEVMNKHLPAIQQESDQLRTGFHSDFSSSQSALAFQKHKSTIQWIGSQQPTGEQLVATNFLRHLYASRESVIRSNVYNPRPQYYGDMQSNLLTPPASDSYKDQAFSTSPLTSAAKSPSTYAVMPTYTTNPITVAMSTPMAEGYVNMTPPSSVSPQEKFQSPFADQCFTDGVSSPYRQYQENSHPMPIKPQAYPLPAHAHPTSYDRSNTQFASPSYYGHAPGFPTYNHVPSPNSSQYRDATKTTNPW